jgi:hypothetical protein
VEAENVAAVAPHLFAGEAVAHKAQPVVEWIVFEGEDRPYGPVAVGYGQLDSDPELEATPNDSLVPDAADATSAWPPEQGAREQPAMQLASHGRMGGSFDHQAEQEIVGVGVGPACPGSRERLARVAQHLPRRVRPGPTPRYGT